MFKSKARPIVVAQAEHGRLSGILASLWGNKNFDRPTIDFGSFVIGVIYHDRGYAYIDNAPIGEADPDEWFLIQERGIMQGFDDPVANIVSLMHIKRLATWGNHAHLIELADQHIQQSLAKTDIPIEIFEWTDKITRFCDNLSFDFSFEAMIQKPIEIHPRRDSTDTVTIHHRLGENGAIYVNPWVFSVEQYSGFITGYEAEGYPTRLEPVYMPFTLLHDNNN